VLHWHLQLDLSVHHVAWRRLRGGGHLCVTAVVSGMGGRPEEQQAEQVRVESNQGGSTMLLLHIVPVPHLCVHHVARGRLHGGRHLWMMAVVGGRQTPEEQWAEHVRVGSNQAGQVTLLLLLHIVPVPCLSTACSCTCSVLATTVHEPQDTWHIRPLQHSDARRLPHLWQHAVSLLMQSML
jgi:hypothetical protein